MIDSKQILNFFRCPRGSKPGGWHNVAGTIVADQHTLSPQHIKDAAREICSGFPEILKALGLN